MKWTKGTFSLMGETHMKIQKIDHSFSVCKVSNLSEMNLAQDYFFIGKTDEEISLVCLTEKVPGNTTEREDGWKAFKIQGILDFSLIGILAPIATLLAENEIGIFAVSTYNTDYILVKEENYSRALQVLSDAGYQIV